VASGCFESISCRSSFISEDHSGRRSFLRHGIHETAGNEPVPDVITICKLCQPSRYPQRIFLELYSNLDEKELILPEGNTIDADVITETDSKYFAILFIKQFSFNVEIR
jgi:hypothetical protein